jgi:hypothetical protein
MVMKKRENIKKKYQPDPYKIIINTCLLLFFSTGVWFLSLRARGQWKKSAKQGFNLKANYNLFTGLKHASRSEHLTLLVGQLLTSNSAAFMALQKETPAHVFIAQEHAHQFAVVCF